MMNQLVLSTILAAILLIPISGNALAQQNNTNTTEETGGNQTQLPADNITITTEENVTTTTEENVTTTEPPATGNVTTGGNVTTEPIPPLPEPQSLGMQECTQAYPNNVGICEGTYGAEPDCVKLNAEGLYNIQVNPPDPFRLDNDADGLGCEISELQQPTANEDNNNDNNNDNE